ncbi:hypothetical protein AVEN_127459-1, partial [Araneus ventricosus]
AERVDRAALRIYKAFQVDAGKSRKTGTGQLIHWRECATSVIRRLENHEVEDCLSSMPVSVSWK